MSAFVFFFFWFLVRIYSHVLCFVHSYLVHSSIKLHSSLKFLVREITIRKIGWSGFIWFKFTLVRVGAIVSLCVKDRLKFHVLLVISLGGASLDWS